MNLKKLVCAVMLGLAAPAAIQATIAEPVTVHAMAPASIHNHGEEAMKAKPVTLEEAKNMALKHAGYAEHEVVFTDLERENEHGTPVYEIEFRKDGRAYEYEIRADNGQIIYHSFDIKKRALVASDTHRHEGPQVTIDQAKAIVLKHARIADNDAKMLGVKMDYDDGLKVYKIRFNHEGIVCEYEICLHGVIKEYKAEIWQDLV